MWSSGSLSLLLFPLLSCFLLQDPSLAFSLKNCTIFYSENVNNVWVTCKDRELTIIPDDIPRNALSLDVSLNLFVQITRTDFRGLAKIKSLDVQRNVISHIDGGAFADLAELLILIMNDNKLTNITDNMFQGLSKLATLVLNSNQISFISPVAFQSLVSLKWVELGSNHLHQVTDIVPLLKLPMIEILSLNYNKLTSFQSDDLPLNISNVRSLSLSLNPLTKFSITTDVFPYLQSLDVSGCSNMEWKVENKTFLRSLTSLFFSGTYMSFDTYREMLQTADSLQKLVLLNLKEWIDGLVDNACKIPSLRSLDVAVCQIETIDDNLLRSCSQLTELILSSNSLSEMSEHSLQSLTQLSLLQLHGNYLSKVPRALRGLSTLDVLDLSSNIISELDCLDFKNLTRLTEVNLNHNRISSLQGCVFENLNDLKVLNMGQNAIFTIQNAFKISLRRLESLNLHSSVLVKLKQGDFRNLSSLCFLDLEADTAIAMDYGIFDGLDHLQNLSLSVGSYQKDFFRGLSHLEYLTLHLTFAWILQSSELNNEPPFSNLPNLKKLVLKVYDKFTTHISPSLLSGLKSLEYLMTEKFFVRSVHPDTFKYTPQLKGLQIIHSDLLYLTPELFWPIPNLKALDLSDNELRSLDFLAQENLLALSWLKLSNNKLSIINETLLHSLPALTYLDLTGNPLTCECSNSGFNLWVLSSNQTQVVNGHQYTCAFPVSQQGTRFLEFDVHSCWIDASFLCFICCFSLIVFTLLTSFTYHFLRWHLTYAYYLFLAFLYDNKWRKKVANQRYDAFVSYNVNDEAWVCRELLPVLEGQQGWKLCLHHRDFEPGKPIVENITEAIYSSRKTICVISRSYLQSEWCSREIQMARWGRRLSFVKLSPVPKLTRVFVSCFLSAASACSTSTRTCWSCCSWRKSRPGSWLRTTRSGVW
uniref:Toll-like receptor 22 n=1 Tax=Acanthochromis polyacanthus TaxID=80966 RepID=A0A3Q1ESV2_9TELE